MEKEVMVVIGVGGMGLAIARRLGSGRTLLLADFDEPKLRSAAGILAEEGHDVHHRRLDVTEADEVAGLARLAAGMGPVTTVVHTAGLSPVQAPTAAVLAVDLLGVALVLEAFAEVVAPGGAGLVISSMAGHMSDPLPADHEKALALTPARELRSLPFLSPEAVGDPGAAYVLAKRANHLRVQAAAGDWGRRGARVNSISPGVISTAMGRQELAGESGDGMRAMVDMSPARRLGTPDDIASAAAFLLGRDATFVTGTDLLVDGGVVAAIRAMPPAG